MKALPFFLLLITINAYGQNPGTPVETPSDILKSETTLLYYLGDNLKMIPTKYTSLDTKGEPISRREFLKQLTTSDYLFIRLRSNDDKLYYRLYKFTPVEQKKYGELISAYLQSYYAEYQWIGKKFPAFS
ncbi:MAG TPA: hypothetical protein VHC47_10975, partial [Mucilaginibacter sp.]|nr:hypothetical protein [Mucilaginibacter sp.]